MKWKQKDLKSIVTRGKCAFALDDILSHINHQGGRELDDKRAAAAAAHCPNCERTCYFSKKLSFVLSPFLVVGRGGLFSHSFTDHRRSCGSPRCYTRVSGMDLDLLLVWLVFGHGKEAF